MRASDRAAQRAFSDEHRFPVIATCHFCGGAIGFGALATRLDVDLSACEGCRAARPALLTGVAAGASDIDACADETARGADIGPLAANPEEPFTSAWHDWKSGWWAGFFSGDPSQAAHEARLALSFSMGWLRY